VSHALYLYAAVVAWTKKYYSYSAAMFGMVAFSLVNHRIEEVYNDDKSLFEWFEKTSVLTVALLTTIQFRSNIDAASWALLSASLLLFLIARKAYYTPGGKDEYFLAHTVWHLGTGFVIIRIVEAAPTLA